MLTDPTEYYVYEDVTKNHFYKNFKLQAIGVVDGEIFRYGYLTNIINAKVFYKI